MQTYRITYKKKRKWGQQGYKIATYWGPTTLIIHEYKSLNKNNTYSEYKIYINTMNTMKNDYNEFIYMNKSRSIKIIHIWNIKFTRKWTKIREKEVGYTLEVVKWRIIK